MSWDWLPHQAGPGKDRLSFPAGAHPARMMREEGCKACDRHWDRTARFLVSLTTGKIKNSSGRGVTPEVEPSGAQETVLDWSEDRGSCKVYRRQSILTGKIPDKPMGISVLWCPCNGMGRGGGSSEELALMAETAGGIRLVWSASFCWGWFGWDGQAVKGGEGSNWCGWGKRTKGAVYMSVQLKYLLWLG